MQPLISSKIVQSIAQLLHGAPQLVLLVKSQAHPEGVRHSLPRRHGAARGAGQHLRHRAQYILGRPLGRDVCFVSFGSSGHQLGCTIAAVSAQRPVEHAIIGLKNITTERIIDHFYTIYNI